MIFGSFRRCTILHVTGRSAAGHRVLVSSRRIPSGKRVEKWRSRHLAKS